MHVVHFITSYSPVKRCYFPIALFVDVADADQVPEADEARGQNRHHLQVQTMPKVLRKAQSTGQAHQGTHRRKALQGIFYCIKRFCAGI